MSSYAAANARPNPGADSYGDDLDDEMDDDEDEDELVTFGVLRDADEKPSVADAETQEEHPEATRCAPDLCGNWPTAVAHLEM